ncbi:MAG: glycosyl transferase [Vicinamibacteria bacterium]|nr:glycosyl transferase [Vicinamibacteria bacterium]
MSAPVREYCTYFDGHYLPRAQALLASLRRHARPFRLHALCLDDAAFAGVCPEPDVTALRLRDLERERPELLAAKHDRSTAAYYFTLTPVLLAHVLEREASISTLTYLDADLYFFASPEPLFEELGPGPLAIVEHRFPERLADLAAWGRFNVGWLTFTRQPEAQRCLLRWREQCLEWCHDRIDGDRFADQKYLDEWPQLFPGTVVLRHPGAGLAPWNAAERELRLQDGRLTVDGAPLVYYHFHGLRDLRPFAFRSGLAEYETPLSPALLWHVYQPYLRELLAAGAPIGRPVQRGA